ncbi:putative lysozyme [Campylobacter rectus RM3267]|uniref:Phage baseplate assembly protein W n=2 Tax=Campylobacter rectus TaxID=203 RepID=A0A6G5QMR3_CAMRE|nr:GPW/gp25 family protein [Campylobacter rectus]EEF14064.1 putative lysozyme [Campylobacter rectus RM3267]QCD46998.1 phage baseplate assembly protein W [Campylobacter rectus]UEB47699.1 GPW/gp25 family protein [Campylobacter rectus]
MYQISEFESIRRICKTSKLTKTLRPTFGLDRYIDKKMTLSELLALKRDLKSQILTFEPRVENLKIELTPRADNILDIRIGYTAKGEFEENEVRLSL